MVVGEVGCNEVGCSEVGCDDVVGCEEVQGEVGRLTWVLRDEVVGRGFCDAVSMLLSIKRIGYIYHIGMFFQFCDLQYTSDCNRYVYQICHILNVFFSLKTIHYFYSQYLLYA